MDTENLTLRVIQYAENIDVPFEDDPDVIGKWKMIDCAQSDECFNPQYSR